MATNLADDFRSHESASSPAVSSGEFRAFSETVNRRLEIQEILDSDVGASNAGPGVFVVNADTTCVHWTAADPEWDHGLQRSNCGWHFICYRFQRCAQPPANTQWDKFCAGCLPDRRLDAMF